MELSRMPLELAGTVSALGFAIGALVVITAVFLLLLLLLLFCAKRLVSRFYGTIKLAVIDAMVEVLTPVLKEALIATFQDPRMASAITTTMSRVMEQKEMRDATESFASSFAGKAAGSKRLNRQAAKFTGSLVAEVLQLMQERAVDATKSIPLLGSAVGKCVGGKPELLPPLDENVQAPDRKHVHVARNAATDSSRMECYDGKEESEPAPVVGSYSSEDVARRTASLRRRVLGRPDSS